MVSTWRKEGKRRRREEEGYEAEERRGDRHRRSEDVAGTEERMVVRRVKRHAGVEPPSFRENRSLLIFATITYWSAFAPHLSQLA